jgi:hypothetical protein
MKWMVLFILIYTHAYAQHTPSPGGFGGNWQYDYRNDPIPRESRFPRYPYEFCYAEDLKKTLSAVEKVCENKMTEFSREHLVECSLNNSYLEGCRVRCYSEGILYAKLRLDVVSDCRISSARLKKTVIKYYK